jgi:hypothetical protein
MTTPSLLERSDHWVLPLDGQVVIQCRYDYALTLIVGEMEPSFILRIEQPFKFSNPDGAVEIIDPVPDPRAMARTLSLVRNTITRSVAHKDGGLEIDFQDGSLVRVSPSDDYEAWHLSGPEGPILVSIPGGDLAVWSS